MFTFWAVSGTGIVLAHGPMLKKSLVSFNLRLPPELHQQLADSAKARFTSINREIVERLSVSFRTAFNPPEPTDLEELARRLAALERLIYGEDQ